MAINCDIKTFSANSEKHFSCSRFSSAGSYDSSFLFMSLSLLTNAFLFFLLFWPVFSRSFFYPFHAPPEEEINLARRGQLCSRKLFHRTVCLPLWGRFIKKAVGRLRISLGMMTTPRRGGGGRAVEGKRLLPVLRPSAQGQISVPVPRWKVSLSVGSLSLFTSLKHSFLANILPHLQ